MGCFDKGFVSVHHWLNQAAVENKVPVLFSETENHLCRIGPLVLPGETARFMCYRMRDVACAENFAEAMGYETFLNNQKKPLFSARGFFPASLHMVAGILANEIIKSLLTLETTLASRVLELNVLNMDSQKHYVLQKPDCPVCFKKKGWGRTHLSLDELKDASRPAGDIYAHKEKLVSPKPASSNTSVWCTKAPTNPLCR